jgi:hypothetical protein
MKSEFASRSMRFDGSVPSYGLHSREDIALLNDSQIEVYLADQLFARIAEGIQQFDNIDEQLFVIGSQPFNYSYDALGSRWLLARLAVEGRFPLLGEESKEPWSQKPETLVFARASFIIWEPETISAKIILPEDNEQYRKVKRQYADSMRNPDSLVEVLELYGRVQEYRSGNNKQVA